ncbi:MAG: alpha/beta hydrolase [Tepidiformaceae bacterium]
MPTAALNGIDIYYEDAGSGFPVVLTHGFSDSAELWKQNVPALTAAGYRVITWDMLGHFRTSAPDDFGRYTQDAVVDDLRALVDHLGIKRAVFGGHSLGGYTSMRFWEKYPAYVTALILSGTGPGYRNPEGLKSWTDNRLKVAAGLEAKGLDTKLDARENHLGMVPEGVTVTHTARGVAWVSKGVMVNPPLVDPSKFDVPVLALVGDRDQAFLNSTDYVANRAPQGRKAIIADAGHPAMFDQPQVWNGHVIEFLKSLTLK